MVAALVLLGGYLAIRRYDAYLHAVNLRLDKQVRQRTKSLRNTRDAIVFALAKLAESRDTDTRLHLDRIRRYVLALSAYLSATHPELDVKRMRDLALASTLHDIGKVGVPDAILLKPGPLDAAEREIMETHAAVGGDCLRAIQSKLGDDDFLELATEIAYCHHERWDGEGYPDKLVGEQIPIVGRITAVADVFDALSSKRCYKDALPLDQCVEIMLKERGKHFDPWILDAFLSRMDEVAEIVTSLTDE